MSSTTDQDLRKAGLKVTSPRLKILAILEKAGDHHLSAENVYHQLKDEGDNVGLATVYRVLTQFETAKLVKRHNFENGYSVFELELGEHHDHLVCMGCGHVQEFTDAEIERRQKKIAENAGFKLTDHSLTLYGQCKNCQ
ncbi:MAG TPA: ferric iron uptake transcriptional regulator [Coxiellaceae bacterium]|nr:ferric iron uptake transcriptional regulator [Coxiellaceae bacterium]